MDQKEADVLAQKALKCFTDSLYLVFSLAEDLEVVHAVFEDSLKAVQKRWALEHKEQITAMFIGALNKQKAELDKKHSTNVMVLDAFSRAKRELGME